MNQLAAPADYADAFQIVGEAAAIRDDYIVKLKKAARFRNRLAHLYWDVDDNELRRILNENLTDLKEFLPMLSDLLG